LKFPHSADPQKWPQDLATRPPKNQLAIQDRGRYIFPFVHNKSHTFSFAASAWEYEKSSEIVSGSAGNIAVGLDHRFAAERLLLPSAVGNP